MEFDTSIRNYTKQRCLFLCECVSGCVRGLANSPSTKLMEKSECEKDSMLDHFQSDAITHSLPRLNSFRVSFNFNSVLVNLPVSPLHRSVHQAMSKNKIRVQIEKMCLHLPVECFICDDLSNSCGTPKINWKLQDNVDGFAGKF